MTSKKPKSLEVPIGLKSTPYFWWFLMNIPPYPSFGRENQTYPNAQGHCVRKLFCTILLQCLWWPSYKSLFSHSHSLLFFSSLQRLLKPPLRGYQLYLNLKPNQLSSVQNPGVSYLNAGHVAYFSSTPSHPRARTGTG